jgi:hypothetical protein
MIKLTDAQAITYRPEGEWLGRSLKNYVEQHPKAKGAKTLTEARKLAFGSKPKTNTCKCGQLKCVRSDGKSSSHC